MVAARIWNVRTPGDERSVHVAYRTALRTVCGLLVDRPLRGGAQHRVPTCATCKAVLREHRALGLAE